MKTIRSILTHACTIALLAMAHAGHAQNGTWTQTNRPHNEIISYVYGGEFSSLAAIGDDIFMGTYEFGAIYSANGDSIREPLNNGLTNLTVNALAVSGQNLYAGTDEGLFLSTDSGMNWIPIPFDTSTSHVDAIGVSGSTIMVATSIGSFLTPGNTFLSTDAGTNWTNCGRLAPSCFAIIGSSLFIGTGDGILLSTNDGANWTHVDSGLSGIKSGIIVSLLNNGGNLFAGTENGVFLSTNEGISWSAAGSQLAGFDITALAANGQNLYAATVGSSSFGVYVSTNEGSSWTVLPDTGLTSSVSSILINNGSIYAAGNGIFRSTDDGRNWADLIPYRIQSVLSTINNVVAAGENVFACTQAGLFVTTDSGTMWTLDSNGMGNVSVTAVAANGKDLFAGTNGNGIFRSTNNGASWTPVDSGLTDENFGTLTQNDGVLYATSDNAILFVSSNNGASWSIPSNGNQGVDAISFAVMGTNLIAGSQSYINYSRDSGKDWYIVIEGPDPTTINSLSTIGGTIYAATSGYGVWLSNDSGMDWIQANDSALPDPDVTTLLANGENLFAGTNTGFILLSSDSGATWEQIDSGLNVGGSEITSLAIKDSNLYAGTTDSGIWRHSLLKIVTAPSSVTLPSLSEASISVYPNPAMNSIAIASSTGPFSIFDPLGRSYDVKQAGNTFDVSSLPAGVYFVSDGRSRVKFVKE